MTSLGLDRRGLAAEGAAASWNGAASTAVRALREPLAGQARVGVVRHVGRTRVGIEVDERLVVLEARHDPATLPCSVVVPRLAPDRFGRPGDPVTFIGGTVACGSARVRVTRWWAPACVTPGRGSSCGSGSSDSGDDRQVPDDEVSDDEVLDDAVRAAVDAAACHLATGRVREAMQRLAGVLGRGAGSTPDADDAIAGLLLTARSALAPGGRRAAHTVARMLAELAPTRTTLLSAELLRSAATGCAAQAVVAAVCHPDAGTRSALLALGGTSGRATAAGIDAMRRAARMHREAA
jgi:hypothetical protein